MRLARPVFRLALALFAGASSATAQNVVQNGGFELPFITGTATLDGCPSGFVWCIGQGNVDLIESLWQPGEGRQSLDLNGDATGSIYQDLATVAGQRYDVSFLFSGNPDGPLFETMELFWGGMDLGQFAWIVGPGQSVTDMLWSRLTIRDVLATTATTRLEFRSTTTAACAGTATPACGPALDGVTVVEAATVPEPSTVALVGLGLAAVGATLRRRRVG